MTRGRRPNNYKVTIFRLPTTQQVLGVKGIEMVAHTLGISFGWAAHVVADCKRSGNPAWVRDSKDPRTMYAVECLGVSHE